MKRIRSDRIILDDRIFDGYLYFENGKIVEVSKNKCCAETEYDLRGYYVSAGFIDIHTHGGGGNSLDGSVDEIIGGCNFHLKHGTTLLCPTVTTAKFESMAASVKNIEMAMNDARLQGTVIGAHLEGPYLSLKQAGAQTLNMISLPDENDYLPFLKRYGKRIARWTYAPENDKDEIFVKTLKEYGIAASAGHTDATYEDMVLAMKNGCETVTHLYSCTSTITRKNGFRKLGVVESAYLLDELNVEIICDGKHLPPELIRLIYKIKGADRIALVTDSLSIAGSLQKHGFLQGVEFIVEDGVCKLADRSAFAGSIATADTLLKVAVKDAGLPLTDAVKMLTQTPAKIVKLNNKGKLACGMDADVVAFDEDIRVKKVFAKGKLIS